MTRHRSALVRRDSLATIARSLNLGSYLYLGRGEEANGGRNKPANLANALEAVIAAVAIDQGLPAARDLITRLFGEKLTNLVRQGIEIDYKSKLQELAQSKKQPTPSYEIVSVTGPDHDRVFTIEVSIGNRVLGTASGKNKKQAEMAAARLALEQQASPD